jgi:hypothetical protein
MLSELDFLTSIGSGSLKGGSENCSPISVVNSSENMSGVISLELDAGIDDVLLAD